MTSLRIHEQVNLQNNKRINAKKVKINCDQRTFCSMRYLTERKEPKNIGKRAIKTKLAYATNIPSGVAAALPVAFLAVSFTAAERFAKLSFTTDSAILTLWCSFVRGRSRQSQSSLLAWHLGFFSFQWPKHTLLLREHTFTCLLFPHYIFDDPPFFFKTVIRLKSCNRAFFCRF